MESPLSRADVAKVAHLARLKLSDDELDKLTTEMGKVLQYIDVLSEPDTEDVEPMAHAAEISNVFRDDEPRESLPRDAALSNAPKTDGKCFVVPQILEGT
jgi:aspartyl-tRNA(Asn)/glutamyl-tRNA(Gln) amidotransferase subunit C